MSRARASPGRLPTNCGRDDRGGGGNNYPFLAVRTSLPPRDPISGCVEREVLTFSIEQLALGRLATLRVAETGVNPVSGDKRGRDGERAEEEAAFRGQQAPSSNNNDFPTELQVTPDPNHQSSVREQTAAEEAAAKAAEAMAAAPILPALPSKPLEAITTELTTLPGTYVTRNDGYRLYTNYVGFGNTPLNTVTYSAELGALVEEISTVTNTKNAGMRQELVNEVI